MLEGELDRGIVDSENNNYNFFFINMSQQSHSDYDKLGTFKITSVNPLKRPATDNYNEESKKLKLDKSSAVVASQISLQTQNISCSNVAGSNNSVNNNKKLKAKVQTNDTNNLSSGYQLVVEDVLSKEETLISDVKTHPNASNEELMLLRKQNKPKDITSNVITNVDESFDEVGLNIELGAGSTTLLNTKTQPKRLQIALPDVKKTVSDGIDFKLISNDQCGKISITGDKKNVEQIITAPNSFMNVQPTFTYSRVCTVGNITTGNTTDNQNLKGFQGAIKNQSIMLTSKKLLPEVTQTTAKVSIGNTTISVPLLKPINSTQLLQGASNSVSAVTIDNSKNVLHALQGGTSQSPQTQLSKILNIKRSSKIAQPTFVSLSQLQIKPVSAAKIVQAKVVSKKIPMHIQTLQTTKSPLIQQTTGVMTITSRETQGSQLPSQLQKQSSLNQIIPSNQKKTVNLMKELSVNTLIKTPEDNNCLVSDDSTIKILDKQQSNKVALVGKDGTSCNITTDYLPTNVKVVHATSTSHLNTQNVRSSTAIQTDHTEHNMNQQQQQQHGQRVNIGSTISIVRQLSPQLVPTSTTTNVSTVSLSLAEAISGQQKIILTKSPFTSNAITTNISTSIGNLNANNFSRNLSLMISKSTSSQPAINTGVNSSLCISTTTTTTTKNSQPRLNLNMNPNASASNPAIITQVESEPVTLTEIENQLAESIDSPQYLTHAKKVIQVIPTNVCNSTSGSYIQITKTKPDITDENKKNVEVNTTERVLQQQIPLQSQQELQQHEHGQSAQQTQTSQASQTSQIQLQIAQTQHRQSLNLQQKQILQVQTAGVHQQQQHQQVRQQQRQIFYKQQIQQQQQQFQLISPKSDIQIQENSNILPSENLIDTKKTHANIPSTLHSQQQQQLHTNDPSSSSSSDYQAIVNREESNNVLLKQLLQNTSSTSSTNCSNILTQTSSNNSTSRPTTSGAHTTGVLARKVVNVRAPSLGLVSSLEAQLARPVIPPVPASDSSSTIATSNSNQLQSSNHNSNKNSGSLTSQAITASISTLTSNIETSSYMTATSKSLQIQSNAGGDKVRHASTPLISKETSFVSAPTLIKVEHIEQTEQSVDLFPLPLSSETLTNKSEQPIESSISIVNQSLKSISRNNIPNHNIEAQVTTSKVTLDNLQTQQTQTAVQKILQAPPPPPPPQQQQQQQRQQLHLAQQQNVQQQIVLSQSYNNASTSGRITKTLNHELFSDINSEDKKVMSTSSDNSAANSIVNANSKFQNKAFALTEDDGVGLNSNNLTETTTSTQLQSSISPNIHVKSTIVKRDLTGASTAFSTANATNTSAHFHRKPQQLQTQSQHKHQHQHQQLVPSSSSTSDSISKAGLVSNAATCTNLDFSTAPSPHTVTIDYPMTSNAANKCSKMQFQQQLPTHQQQQQQQQEQQQSPTTNNPINLNSIKDADLRKKRKRDQQKQRRQLPTSATKATNATNLNTASSTPNTPNSKKRSRKSVKFEEDYDTFIDNLLTHMRQMQPLQVLEPQLNTNYDVCKIYGWNKSVVRTGSQNHNYNHHIAGSLQQRLLGEYGSAYLPNQIQNYNPKKIVNEKSNTPLTTTIQNNYYDQEFSSFTHKSEYERLASWVKMHKERNIDSPEVICTKKSQDTDGHSNYLQQDAFSGLILMNENYKHLGRMSPVIPLINSMALVTKCKKITMQKNTDSNHYLNHAFNREASTDSKAELKNCDNNQTVILSLPATSPERIYDVLKNLANILQISTPLSYKILDGSAESKASKTFSSPLDMGTEKYSNAQKCLRFQQILNGKSKVCRNCGKVINSKYFKNSNDDTSLKTSLYSALLQQSGQYFCNKDCFVRSNSSPNEGCSASKVILVDPFQVECKSNKTLKGNVKSIPGLDTTKDTKSSIETVTTTMTTTATTTTTTQPPAINIPSKHHKRKVCFRYFNSKCFQNSSVIKRISEKDIRDLLFKMNITISANNCCKGEAEDKRQCVLCSQYGDGVSDGTSRLLNFDVDKWVHLNCALWSTDVYETISGGLMHFQIALQMGLNQICNTCQQLGATVKCYKTRCSAVYHLPCAIRDKCVFYQNKTIHCQLHASRNDRDKELPNLTVQRKVYVERDENRQLASVLHPSELMNLLRVGSLIFLNVGQLLPHQMEAFHTPNYIYPIGYKIVRFYWSMRRPNKRCRYICSIAEVNGRPEFRIVVQEPLEVDLELRDSTPKGVWQQVLQSVVDMRKANNLVKLYPEYINGEDLFGLTEPSIMRIIESLPGVETLTNYRFKYGRNPLLDLPLALNPSGSARTEPKLRSSMGWKKSHTHRTCSPGNYMGHLSIPSMIAASVEPTCPYSKQFVHSKSSQYKKMKLEWRNNVFLARSKIQGLGLYAARDVEKHTMIIEYIGEVIRSEVSEMREKQYESKNRGIYMFRLDEDRVVDATLSGGLARYINHSCNPNCQTEIVEVERDLRIIIFSKRKINRGEELSYDYKFDIEDDGSKIACMCGAPNCRKWMN